MLSRNRGESEGMKLELVGNVWSSTASAVEVSVSVALLCTSGLTKFSLGQIGSTDVACIGGEWRLLQLI